MEHPKGYCPVFGNLPKEYDKAVHGPFYAWRDYRNKPKDLDFKDVKLGEMRAWLARREKTPTAVIQTISRYANLYSFKWVDTKFGSFSKSFLQVGIMMSFCSMISLYGYLRHHRAHKYHW